MEYLFIIVLIIITLFILFRFSEKRKDKIMRNKIREFEANGFPKFTKDEQLEMLYSGKFDLINERMNMKVVPTTCFTTIFSVTKKDLEGYIKEVKNIIKDKNIKQNQSDGIWIDIENDGYLIYERERGQILSTRRFSNIDEIIREYTKVMMNIIPKDNKSSMTTFIIKR